MGEFFGALEPRLDPGITKKGPLPPERAHRKRCQIVAIARLVEALLPPPPPPKAAATATAKADVAESRGRPLVVDFCGGSGHTALVLAARHLECDVLVVDYNETSLRIAEARAKELGLTNFSTACADVSTFDTQDLCTEGERYFALGIALHACGAATDLAMGACARAGAGVDDDAAARDAARATRAAPAARTARADASKLPLASAFVVSPCCVGKVAQYGQGRPISELKKEVCAAAAGCAYCTALPPPVPAAAAVLTLPLCVPVGRL